MGLTVSTIASFISNQADSGGGSNADITLEICSGSNSVHEVGGAFYVLILSGDRLDPLATRKFEMWKSLDSGATWASVGSDVTPSVYGGGMSSFVVGTQIRFAYSKRFALTPTDAHLYTNYYDTLTDTWGTEVSFDCGDGSHGGTDMRVEGPYATHVRPDNSIVYLISDTLTAEHYAVVFDGSFHAPVLVTPTAPQLFETSVMEPDGTIDIFYGNGYDPATLFHQTFSTSNVAGTPATITYTGEILSWNDIGLMHGFEDAGTFYLAAGAKTGAYPTIYGKPAILYGNDGGWTLGAVLDTDVTYADYSVWSCALRVLDGNLVYYWRGVSSDGTEYLDRIGVAPVGSHDTPANWTWTKVYGPLSTPSPLVDSLTAPYDIPGPGQYGATTGLSQTDSAIRIVCTMRNRHSPTDDKMFVAYMYLVAAETIGNSFRVGRSFLEQG